LPDQSKAAFVDYMMLLGNKDMPLSVKLAGADMMMDKAYAWVSDTQPEAADYDSLVEIKETIYNYQKDLLKTVPDFNKINTRLPVDVTGVEQAQLYTQAIDWTTPIVEGSLKQKIFGQVVNLAKDHDTHKFNENPSDLVKMALVVNDLQTQLQQQSSPEILPEAATEIFAQTADKMLTNSLHMSASEQLEYTNKLLLNLNGVNVAKFLGGLNYRSDRKANLLRAIPEQLEELITNITAAKQKIQPTLNDVSKSEAAEIVYNTLKFDTLLGAVIMERPKDLPQLLPHLAAQKPALALAYDAVTKAQDLRADLAPNHQAELDLVVARGAVNYMYINKNSASEEKKEFALYYAKVKSKPARDNMKAALVDMVIQSPHKAESAATLIDAGRNQFKRQSKIPTFMINMADALEGDKYKVVVRKPAPV
jgi:hypothetical protein